MPHRLFAPDDPTVKVGIPREGELFSAEDADRLVGAGLAVRRDPRKRRSPKPRTNATPAPPAPEG